MKAPAQIQLLASLLLLAANAPAAVRYVNVSNGNPSPPYTDWLTAATNIQDAVDAAAPGDQILVTNGVYQTGGRAVSTNLLVNRVAVTKPVTIQSVNGPEATIILGFTGTILWNLTNGIRCVYLANGAVLMGFTLTNGFSPLGSADGRIDDTSGGGVWCESTNATVSNCVVTGNSAWLGGGAWQGTLIKCTLINNFAYEG